MAEIVLVRHGQASFGKANYDKLSELGGLQAEWLGHYFAHIGQSIDAIWRGDMVRHHETAQGIVTGLARHKNAEQYTHLSDFAVYPGLNEFDFQAVADAYLHNHPDEKPEKTAAPAEFYRLLRKSMLAWSAGQLDETLLPETWQQFQQRVMSVLDAAIASPHKRIVLATSGGAIAMMISQVLGADAATMVNLNLQIRNTSVSQLFANRKGVHLHQFNAVPHLEHPEKRESITYS